MYRTLLLTSFLAALTWALCSAGCGPADASASGKAEQAKARPDPLVRVLLGRELTRAALGSDAAVIITGLDDTPAVRATLPRGLVRVTRDAAGWRIGDGLFVGGVLTLTPADPAAVIRFESRAYRGRLRLVPGTTQGTFDVVNDLGVEDYLAGVLPMELPGDWTDDAHAAQAVAARTYALYEVRTAGPGRGHFDVFDDDRSQVYGGATAETRKARRAVASSRGEVVTHATAEGPRIFKAYFHSTSGGATIGVDDAFHEPPIAPLSAQLLGELGRASSRFAWEPLVLQKDEMTRRMRLWGERRGHPIRRMSALHELAVASRSPHGRPTRYEIVDAVGRRFSLSPEQVRWALNTDRGDGAAVLSGWFRPINNERNVVLADGRGWGHGVGMCQWSAEGMARGGLDYRRIVARSYPDSRVYRAY